MEGNKGWCEWLIFQRRRRIHTRTKGARDKDSPKKDKDILREYHELQSTEDVARKLGLAASGVQYRMRAIRRETGLDPYKEEERVVLLEKCGYFQRGSQNVICPIYIGHKTTLITCEGVEEGMQTSLTFAEKAKREEYMNNFCRCKCYEGCAIYQITGK